MLSSVDIQNKLVSIKHAILPSEYSVSHNNDQVQIDCIYSIMLSSVDSEIKWLLHSTQHGKFKV